MSTYDFTVGGPIGLDHRMKGRNYWVPIDINVADIIAANATLTANAKITSADVLQIFDIPAGTMITGRAVFETITAGTASATADIGTAADDYLFDGVALDATAGTLQVSLVGADWGPDNVTGVTFATTDTLDFEAKADILIGHWVLWFEIIDLNKSGLVEGY